MINKKRLCKKNDPLYPVYPDTSVYDVDIDFELNNGKGAWVVILKRQAHYPRPARIKLMQSNLAVTINKESAP